jgi:tripartite-type tricarboxylate transporter receptor subunit TctC
VLVVLGIGTDAEDQSGALGAARVLSSETHYSSSTRRASEIAFGAAGGKSRAHNETSPPKAISASGSGCCLPAFSRAASAQAYPTRPITVIVPFAAGGPADTVARIVSERMRTTLRQPMIIENMTGATGSVGVGRAVRAPADGYTLIAGTLTTHVLIGALYTLQYDLLKDFKPVALLADGPLLMTARQTMPTSDLKELIAWLKANPDKASQGITGVGAVEHVAAVLFQKQTGTRFQIVPYRGNGPAMQDLVAGQIDMMLADAATCLPYVNGGQIKAYAVMAKTRMAAAPNVPTVDEAGLPGFYASLWYGLWAPVRAPADVIAKLNAAAVEALADPAVRKRLAELGQDVPPLAQQTPEALGAVQKAEIEKWWPVMKAANIRAE